MNDERNSISEAVCNDRNIGLILSGFVIHHEGVFVVSANKGAKVMGWCCCDGATRETLFACFKLDLMSYILSRRTSSGTHVLYTPTTLGSKIPFSFCTHDLETNRRWAFSLSV